MAINTHHRNVSVLAFGSRGRAHAHWNYTFSRDEIKSRTRSVRRSVKAALRKFQFD